MKIFFLLLGFTFFISVKAQDLNSIIDQAISLENKFDEEGALAKLNQAIKIDSKNAYCLVRAADIACRIGSRVTDKVSKDEYFEAADIYINVALKLYPTSSLANTTMAILKGRMALSKSGKEKVKFVKDIKKYAEIALQYDATNEKALHVMGRWHAEVSNLSGAEKLGAKILFGGLPKASLAEALAFYQKINALNKGFITNFYEMAKCYKRMGQKENALQMLQKIETLPPIVFDDLQAKKDALTLKSKL